MASAADLFGFDTVTLKGAPLDRAKAALRVARLHVRLANADTKSARLEDVLSEIEDEIGVHISRIDDAVMDDADALEASGEAQRLRQAELPLRAA
jgi:hypothetical protein